MNPGRIPLHLALSAGLGVSLLVGLAAAGWGLDRRLGERLLAEARHDLEMAPKILGEQEAALSDAMMMRAKDLAGRPEVVDAFTRRDRSAARSATAEELEPPERPVLVGPDGEPWLGPRPGSEALDATRRGRMPIEIVRHADGIARMALAPVKGEGRWLGAAGWTRALDRAAVERLAGLTQTDVTIVDRSGRVEVTTLDPAPARALSHAARVAGDSVRTVESGAGSAWLVARAPLSGRHAILFSRDRGEVLAPLPGMRRAMGIAGLVALGLALGLGVILTGTLTRPVRSLADAARGLGRGEFDAPLERSALREIDRLGVAFDRMRTALKARMRDLERANESLADRQRRLTVLQAELVQRDRLATTARLVAGLAHEIRNPVASLKNCLEIVRRRVDDPRAAEFTDLALEELLRMHELAEQMLDAHRPRADGDACDPAEVAREVRALVEAGGREEGPGIRVRGSARAAIPRDALKQILLNLVHNAREAGGGGVTVTIDVEPRGETVRVDVADDGPGIDDPLLPRVFDPFFTTKGSVHGTGLGLYVVDGLVRRHGGRVTAENLDDGPGLLVRLELVAAEPRETAPAVAGEGDRAPRDAGVPEDLP